MVVVVVRCEAGAGSQLLLLSVQFSKHPVMERLDEIPQVLSLSPMSPYHQIDKAQHLRFSCGSICNTRETELQQHRLQYQQSHHPKANLSFLLSLQCTDRTECWKQLDRSHLGNYCMNFD
jgi:hypothetical protein